jgi:putative tryptophan/tyrosine transport system substrate-binding protein
MMDRRAFVTGFGAVLAAPLRAEPQGAGPKLPRVGYVSGASDSSREEAFRRGLRELGYTEGQNIVVIYRFADGRYERLPDFVDEFLRLNVAVIVAATTPAIHAAQRATRSVPIVMTLGEPSEARVASLARPGGNTTGLSTINTELGAKRLELLREALPRLSRVAVLYNPTNPISVGQLKSVQTAGHTLGVQVQLLPVTSVGDLAAAFDAVTRARAEAVMAMPDQLLGGPANGRQLADLALKNRLATISWTAGHARIGMLMSYGPDEPEMHRRAATYVDKILKGAAAGDLPIEQPAQFMFVINRKTAKALGLTIPPSLLLRADQVIE